MARHLSVDDVPSVLARGRGVEAFCGSGAHQGTVRWVSLIQAGADVRATLFEVVAHKDPEFLDIYEFEPAPGTDPDGVVERLSFAGVIEAIAHLKKGWGVDSSRFVNAGVVQDEYSDYSRKLVGQVPQ